VLAGIREHSIEKVKGEMEKMGRKVIAVQTDISKWEDAQKMAQGGIE
jgi:hypothetical protein